MPEVQVEGGLNNLLRRADWRFLLGRPRPSRSVCCARGWLARAVALVSRDMVEARGAPSAECDLAVAVNPSAAVLSRAWTALAPGGGLYSEWYSPLAGCSGGIKRRLEAAGFHGVTCYWAWPWVSHARFWLPVYSPAALKFFLDGRSSGRSLHSRLWLVLRRAAFRILLRTRLFPVCAVAWKPSMSRKIEGPGVRKTDQQAPDSVVTGGPLKLIADNWSKWGLNGPVRDLSWIVVTLGQRSISKVVGLVFTEPDPRPRLAVKMSRVPEAEEALRREAQALRAIAASRPAGVPGVPRLLFLEEHGGLLMLGETAFSGTPLYTRLDRGNMQRLAMAAASWQVGLAGQPARCPRADWWGRLIEPVLANFEASFGRVLDPALLGETRRCLESLGDLPIVPEQRDFSPWNVLVTGDSEFAVLDWESAEPRGLPALDLIYFLAHLAFFLDGAYRSRRFLESYRTSLDPTSLSGSVASTALGHYCERLEVDETSLRPLRLLAWLIHTRSAYQRLTADAKGSPSPAALRSNLYFSLWAEQLRDCRTS